MGECFLLAHTQLAFLYGLGTPTRRLVPPTVGWDPLRLMVKRVHYLLIDMPTGQSDLDKTSVESPFSDDSRSVQLTDNAN